MKLRAEIAHAMPGRLRMRVPEQRGNAELFAQLEQHLAQSQLLERVQINPVTGSVLLEFEGPHEALLDKLAGQLPFEFDVTVPASPSARRPPSTAGLLDPLRLVSGRDIDQMFITGALFGAVGLVQALRGQILIPALPAFWYATNAFRLARQAQAAKSKDEQADAGGEGEPSETS